MKFQNVHFISINVFNNALNLLGLNILGSINARVSKTQENTIYILCLF